MASQPARVSPRTCKPDRDAFGDDVCAGAVGDVDRGADLVVGLGLSQRAEKAAVDLDDVVVADAGCRPVREVADLEVIEREPDAEGPWSGERVVASRSSKTRGGVWDLYKGLGSAANQRAATRRTAETCDGTLGTSPGSGGTIGLSRRPGRSADD
jgi:hypothetical protein